jgi:hypothetical protein
VTRLPIAALAWSLGSTMHKTLQDRLVKELRLAGASGLAEGNARLQAFIADYNMRFAKLPANGSRP